MPYWHYSNGGWVSMLLMLITVLILVGGLITVSVIVLRRTTKTSTGHDDAIKILNERFARGEIDKDEFETRRAVLRG
ncbi:SHOCT domain-containing protein [Streptomyces sp. WAC 05977]|uniref:Putative membrane protein n=1 Tax=Amycolatopsis keratiniphila TaxID=129921 RepID=R4T9G5_9PSEU|nr:SHOCT domain-containing protein [Amycolatopsis keratiniphila]AGM07188.1 putative membrane protein [Amycolatopsis keratiniphila]RSN24194.1 SHOCT domain-containing protein [Streptomyces sp. WAC 05977]